MTAPSDRPDPLTPEEKEWARYVGKRQPKSSAARSTVTDADTPTRRDPEMDYERRDAIGLDAAWALSSPSPSTGEPE